MLLAFVLSALPNPSPAFQATPLYPCTSYPAGGVWASAVCDFDRDGHLDVLVGNQRGVEILRGDGTGRLEPSRALVGMPAGQVVELAIADFNGDGWLDVAALRGAPTSSKRLTIAVSDQNGGVTSIFNSPQSSLSGLITGDLDGDARAEFLLRAPGPKPTLVVRSSASSVQLLRLAVDMPWLVADVDGDGADEAFATPTGSSTSLMYSGFSSTGWSSSVSTPFGKAYESNVADLDSDGDLELLIRQSWPNFLTIVDFSSSATFTLRDVDFADGNLSFPPVVGDYDGDGRTDLLVSSWSRPKVLLDVAGSGPLQFLPYFGHPDTVSWGPGTPQPAPIRVGDAGTDLNEDGADDVVLSGGELFGVLVTLSNGQGALAVEAPVKDSTRYLVAGDVNGDSHQDVLVHDETSFHVLLGDGQGQLAPHCTVAFPSLYSGNEPQLFDWDGDGDLDLLIYLGGARMHLNDGAGCFAAASPPLFLSHYFTEFGHFDGDAFLDAVGGQNLYRGDGAGGLHPPVPTSIQFAPMTNHRVESLGDLDADGLDDVAAFEFYAPVVIYRGTTNGQFMAHLTLPITPEDVVGGDFNGDGNRDLAWAGWSASGYSLGVMYGDGAGGFSAPTTLETGLWPYHDRVLAMDLNNDGRDDLVNKRWTGTGYYWRTDIYQALATGGFERLPGPVLVGFQGEHPVADFNSDGFADFVVLDDPPGYRYHTRLLLSR